MSLQHSYLLSILDYDSTTGIFTWKVNRKNNITAGTRAGHLTSAGYISIKIDNEAYQAHSLAWLYIYGKWVDSLDHINLCKSHNSINNLRISSKAENNINKFKQSNNTTGFKGVSFRKAVKKYVAHIGYKGLSLHLGYFDDPLEAFLVRQAAEIELYGDFAHFPMS